MWFALGSDASLVVGVVSVRVVTISSHIMRGSCAFIASLIPAWNDCPTELNMSLMPSARRFRASADLAVMGSSWPSIKLYAPIMTRAASQVLSKSA